MDIDSSAGEDDSDFQDLNRLLGLLKEGKEKQEIWKNWSRLFAKDRQSQEKN